ncbi:hypothetical protein Tco_0799758, partial [Tanacetum coccineum]
NTSKSVSNDPFPKSSEFNAEHYATLVAYPAPFHKYPEPFLCFVRVGERQRAEDEPRLLDTTVGRVVPLLPIVPARAESELDASVDKIFNEGGSGNQAEQGDSESGGHGVGIQLVSEAAETIVKDAAPVQPRRQRKRKTIVYDASGPSHPPKKLREDHGTPSGALLGGKSRSMVQRLLAKAVQNAEVRGETIPTLPFVTSSVSTTPEREDEDSSHHSGANIAEAEVDSFARPSVPLMTVATTVTSIVDPATTVKEKFVRSFIFCGDSSSGGVDHTVGGFFDLTGSDFILGGIRTVISLGTNLQKVYIPQWSVTNGSRLDYGRTCREMVDEFAPLNFFASVWEMEHDQLFTEFNVGAARQMSLSAEVRMRAEYNIKEKRRLNSVVEGKNSLLKAKDKEVESLKAQLLMKEAEVAEAIRLLADLAASVKVWEQEVADLDAQEKVTAYEKFIDQLEKFQDEKMKEVNEKFDKLCIDFVEMTLHLEEKFYLHLLTTIFGRRWLFTHSMELAIAKCLNSTEYISTLGAAIGKAVEKGMQEGLSARITYGVEECQFSLIAELKQNKDASVDTIMNLLRLEDTLAERLGLTGSQSHVNKLMVPIHHSPNQCVIGASALSLSLDVSSSRVWKIKENIANHVSALRDVFVPLSEPLSAMALEGTEGTSGAAPGTTDTTTALSIVVASTSTVRPISIDNDEVNSANDHATTNGSVANEDANPFPIVDDAELNILE